jgi:hypothetical protein
MVSENQTHFTTVRYSDIHCMLFRTWYNMAILEVEIVMWSIDIAGHHRGELAAVLLSIAPIHDINHSLGVAVPKI